MRYVTGGHRPRLYGEFPDLDTKVSFLVDSNPKRLDTKSWRRFERYFKANPETVQEMLNAGASREDIRWNWGHEIIALNPDPMKRKKK
jgi:hypothetical protein